jgi:hypothetical protein
MRWRRAAWALIGLGMLTLFLVTAPGLLNLALFGPSPFNDLRFNRQAWLKGEGRDNPRGKMLQDLLDHQLMKGMERARVLQLLGPPDNKLDAHQSQEKFRDSDVPLDRKTDQLLEYHLGAWSGFRMDEDFLEITFDKEGRLLGAWRVQN